MILATNFASPAQRYAAEIGERFADVSGRVSLEK
jgi:hypothetical protein